MNKRLKLFWQIYIISSILVPFMWIINLPIICFILPLYLTWKNIRHFMDLLKKQLKEYSFWINDGLIFFLGTGLSWLALEGAQVVYVDWLETLVNSQIHSPIQTEAWSGQFFLLLLGVLAYLVLNIYQTRLLPPLLTVLLISCLYPSFVFAVLWTIQLSTLIETDFFTYCYLCLAPFNICLIYSRTILQTIQLWQAEIAKQSAPRFPRLSALLQKSLSLPIWLLFFSLPYLAVLGSYLILFGQKPDQLLQMWTETSDWALSEKISPPNAFYDEHYLCTVGAAGHRKLVKPIRMGERHGHRVVVNRQLQIANAFEQILEERCPRLHGRIRSIYDRYGYPISKHIRNVWQADLIYLIMKPAEWFFLFVIYLHDCQPENRIARQYLPLSKNLLPQENTSN
ncbi:hypothetical protein HO663_02025 [Streptococcus suis]|uniref:Membrane protein n=2 Tax=Streptococcus suis TaxID=1307 RepID=A0A0Z8FBF8_STRSU|nr:DUF6688 family protein [Streptococcus suis]NQH26873.1 hypothetical protein [Streptococcus suis]NQH31271.1 hypothetical protein [Streptococcus suis]NQH47813.1 hypothetical protein [Streptococcus suis]NQP01174.1 hypothetical protein [Streptococcus suis]NQP42052.1 hypothetical protein [Streptococcus suis]